MMLGISLFIGWGKNNAPVTPTLKTLTLSASTFAIGVATSGTINGATTGSTITASGLPSGLTINGAARTWAWSGTGSAGTGNLTLTETLEGATGSPKDSVIGYEVTAAQVTPQYGRTPNYDAGTDGDWFVAPDGSDSADGSVATPFATLGKALSVAQDNQTIRLRGGADEASIVKYRESNTLSGKSNLRIASYGTEYAELSGALRVTGFTVCTSGDEAIVGPNYASIYKATIAASAIAHTAYHALILTEADVPLDLVQMRRDRSKLFALDDYTTMYAAQAGDDVDIGVDGSGHFQTITHASVLENYTDAQLARCVVAIHAEPNVIGYLKVASASGGVLTVAANTLTPDTAPDGERYALLNVLPEMAEGQWAYVDNGDSTLTLYVWPTNGATINSSIDVAARKSVLSLTNCTGLEIDGLYVSQCSGDLNYDSSPIRLTGCGGSIHDLHCRNYSSGQGQAYGSIYAFQSAALTARNITIRNGQNSFGMFFSGGTGDRVKALDVMTVSQSPVRVYTESLIAMIDIKTDDFGFGAHANQFNAYINSDRWVLIGYNPINPAYGYGTCQRSSRGLILNSIMTMGRDGRGFDDQSGTGAPPEGPTVNPSDNYFIGNFIWPDPARMSETLAAASFGDTTDGTNWYVYNNVLANMVEHDAGTLIARKNNVLFKGVAGDASEQVVSDPLDAFYDPVSHNWKTVPGSPLLTKAGYDVESVIAMYEDWFPDVDFRRDITGAAWNPADPGVGPYGKSWPVQADTTAPVLSAFDDGTPGPLGSTCSVTTDEFGGKLYWVRLANGAATPSAAQVIAGKDASGAAAGDAGNQAVSATGAQSFDMTGASATTYKIAAVHQDRSGNASNVLTGSVTLAAAYSPSWVAFDGAAWLKRSGAIAGAQATTQSFLIAVTHKYATGTQQSSFNAGILLLGSPSARSIQVDNMGSNRLRAIMKAADATTGVIFDGYVAAQTDKIDVEFLTLFAGANDGTDFRMQIRSINLATGSVITTADETVATSNSVSFAGFTACDLLKAPGTYERVMLWDNATADITDEAVRDLFFDHAAGELVDPAVAVAAIGTPLISFYGSRLTSGSNAGSGGDWTFS